MGIKVAKFGGTSLADARQFRKVQAIIESDPDRRYVVPSAPGRRAPEDRKVTDLLYLCHAHAQQNMPFDEIWSVIEDRFQQIVNDLELKLRLDQHLDQAKRNIAAGASADYAASRGEYLNGLILAELLGFEFIDAARVIFFDTRGMFDSERTQEVISKRLKKVERAVIPGFYGTAADGGVKTFSRGGSDITGSIVARGASAEVYENWTDVSGLLMADPRVVDNPRKIDVLTYRELRELSYTGATVLHDESIFPVRKANIPVNIRNTNEPDEPGTMIVSEAERITHLGTITGIAGRKDFSVIAVEKALMNQEVGFGRRVLSALEVNGVSFEHIPSGIDTISLVISDAQLKGKLDRVIDELRRQCNPDSLEIYPDMAIIATVGRGMAHTPGIAAKIFGALSKAGVNIRMIDQGSSEINVIVGVQTSDYEKAVRAIYKAFVE